MSALFPARLEEWERARAQGAFFVEQTVVRTSIEKTGEPGVPPELLAPPPGGDAAGANGDAIADAPTTATAPISPDAFSIGDATTRLPTPLPFARVATPPGGLPAASAPGFGPASAGTFGLPAPALAGDDMPHRPSAANFEETKLVRVGTSNRTPLLVGLFGLMAISGMVLALVLGRGGDSMPAAKPAAKPAQVAQPAAQPPAPPAPPAAVDPTPPPATPPAVDPTPPTPPSPPQQPPAPPPAVRDTTPAPPPVAPVVHVTPPRQATNPAADRATARDEATPAALEARDDAAGS